MRRAGIPFDKQCRAVGLPTPAAEVRFHPTRRWRFDWAFVPELVAVEVEGGVFIAGRHSRGAGMVKDMEKYNAAALLGWRVLRVTPSQIVNGEALNLVEQMLGSGTTAAMEPASAPRRSNAQKSSSHLKAEMSR